MNCPKPNTDIDVTLLCQLKESCVEQKVIMEKSFESNYWTKVMVSLACSLYDAVTSIIVKRKFGCLPIPISTDNLLCCYFY